jgi:hypothetical protein
MDWTKCFIRLLNFASSHGVPGLEQISLLPVALLGFTLRVVKITKYVCNVIFPIVANSIKPSAFVESRARRSF